MTVESEYVRSHTEELYDKYAGKWIIVYGTKVVASDKDCGKACRKARKTYPRKNLYVMKVLDGPPALI